MLKIFAHFLARYKQRALETLKIGRKEKKERKDLPSGSLSLMCCKWFVDSVPSPVFKPMSVEAGRYFSIFLTFRLFCWGDVCEGEK